MSNIEMLGKFGDPLERAIVRESIDELGWILKPYSDIWRAYVQPNRIGAGETLMREWMLFGGSHYTALIRAHNALGFYKGIVTLCERGGSEDDGTLLLGLQSATSGFWWSLGALVDNLGQALERFPGSEIGRKGDREASEKDRDPGANLLKTEKPFLKYLYQRRTQLIHSRVVPIAMDTGYAMFDYGYLDDERREALPAATEWKSEFRTREDLDKFYADTWERAKTELAASWHLLRRKIDGFATRMERTFESHKGRPFESVKLSTPPIGVTVVTASSACPHQLPGPPGPSGT